MFALYSNTAGTPTPVLSCPLDANGVLLPGTQSAQTNLFNGSGCANIRTQSMNNSDSENLIVLKIDHTINAKDSIWYRFQQDTGLQAAYTDAINPIFNAYSPQPQRTLVTGYTHLFTSNLINQFNPGASWYSSLFLPNDYPQVLQTFPIVLAGGSSNAPFTTMGGNDQTYTQGRKVTQWQINDNLIWTHGRQQLQVRRELAQAGCKRLRPGRRRGAHRGLQRSCAVHLWRGVHRDRGLSGDAEGEHRAGQPRPVRDGHLQGRRAMDADGGAAGNVEYESGESAQTVCAAGGVVSRYAA
jgi:hypothetical protein